MKLAGVEAARSVAALLVVFAHASGVLGMHKYYGVEVFNGLFIFARAGVDFFFVLSGFIIAYVHASDIGFPNRLSAFAWKRFVRIYPTYWIVSLLLIALLLVSPTSAKREQDIIFVVWSLLLLPTVEGPMLGQGWSLIHELLFYALFGVMLLHRRLGRVLLAGWGAGIAFNMVWKIITGTPWFDGIWDNLVFRVFNIQFFFGLAVAALVLRGLSWRPHLVLAAGVMLFFGIGLLDSWGPDMPHEWPPLHLVYALGAALALYGLVTAERERRLWVPRSLAALGSASYALYLTHMMVVLIGAELLLRAGVMALLPVEVAFALIVVGAVIAAEVFYRWLERPLLHRWRRPSGARLVVAGAAPGRSQ